MVRKFSLKSLNDVLTDSFFDRGFGFYTNQELLILRKLLKFSGTQSMRIQGFPGLGNQKWFIKFKLNCRSPGKIDTQICPSEQNPDNGHQSQRSQNARYRESNVPLSHKINICFPKNFHHDQKFLLPKEYPLSMSL